MSLISTALYSISFLLFWNTYVCSYKKLNSLQPHKSPSGSHFQMHASNACWSGAIRRHFECTSDMRRRITIDCLLYSDDWKNQRVLFKFPNCSVFKHVQSALHHIRVALSQDFLRKMRFKMSLDSMVFKIAKAG